MRLPSRARTTHMPNRVQYKAEILQGTLDLMVLLTLESVRIPHRTLDRQMEMPNGRPLVNPAHEQVVRLHQPCA